MYACALGQSNEQTHVTVILRQKDNGRVRQFRVKLQELLICQSADVLSSRWLAERTQREQSISKQGSLLCNSNISCIVIGLQIQKK